MIQIGLILHERYELIAEIGKGGMSTVYLAKDKMLGSYWAVKQVKNDGGKDIKAFKKEVELLSGLNNPDIPRIVDRVEYGNDFYVVMDFVDGVSLGKKVLSEGPQKENDVVEWAKMLCDILEYLHTVNSNPIIYRDLKPDNIMLAKTGRVKLIDFGIAKECKRDEVQTGEAIGTKGYAAPEQYKGASNILDERTDGYSFGATLFYLLTGIVPNKPPYGVKPIREMDAGLSEGIEYIIQKCTKDVREERYNNFKEIKEDLININKLNSSYKNKMRKKLASFYISCAAFLLCIIPTVTGYTGVQAEKTDNYQYYYQQAISAIKSEDYETAAQCYSKSIEYKPELTETYLLYFNSVLPRQNDDNYITITKNAIDIMRNSYVDNENSQMYHNPVLMYNVMKKCVDISDSSYAEYAVKYIDLLEEIEFEADDMQYYAVLASNCSQNLATQDFATMNDAILKLEEYTDSEVLSTDNKLENYYTIMVLYSEYSVYFDDSYDKIFELGVKSKELIDSNINSEELIFSSIIPMYELTASSLCNSAVLEKDIDKKAEKYELSLEWFRYLDDLNDNLSEMLWLKKANIYINIYDISGDPEEKYLENSISEYQEMIGYYPDSFLGHVYLAIAYLEMEENKDESNRDYSLATEAYNKAVDMKESSKNLSSTELSQFGSMKQAFINAGLAEE